MTVYCQNCGKDTAGHPVTFYGNVLCGDACRKQLSERVYFRDTPPEPGSTWFCPHCGAGNPLGDPRKNLRPNCASCSRPLDPASAAPPRKGGCLSVLLLLLLPLGIATQGAACAGRRPPPTPSSGALPAPDARVAAAAQSAPGSVRAAREAGKRAAQAAAGKAAPPAPPAPTAPTGSAADVDADGKPRYEFGAKFEPPVGRILHGMGQWETGNAEYLAMLEGTAQQPAGVLIYHPLGDWGRRPPRDAAKLADTLAAHRAAGRITKLDITPCALDEASGKELGIDREIAAGETRYDDRIRGIARAVRDCGGPVFVSVGDEFSGDWHDYTPYDFPKVYRHVVEIFRAEGVTNVAWVWTYEPAAPEDFDVHDDRGWRWYPGDDVVDWFGLDLFEVDELSGPVSRVGRATRFGAVLHFLDMAREHGKPVILPEVSPARMELTTDEKDGRTDWDRWFVPFVRFLDQHPQVKGFFYENVDWRTVGQSAAQGWGEARINVNPYLADQWRAEMRRSRYLHASDLHLLNGWAETQPPPADAVR